MKINYERDSNGIGDGYGGYGRGRGGCGNGNGYGGNGFGDGSNGCGNGYDIHHTLYLLHPFAPLADFDAWMLHLQVEGRVRR